MTARLAQCSTWVRIPKPALKKDAESFFKDALKADPKSILVVKSKATWSGYLLNGRCYPGVHMEQGIPTWCSKDRGGVAPYDMPVLLNHDAKVDAIGRVIAASYHRIAAGDAWFGDWKMPAREFNKGSGYTELTMAISDEAAQQKFLDGRYVTFSTAFRSPFAGCSICHTNLMQETCDHTIGDTYETPDGSERECYIITGAQFNKECSVVNHPAQPWAVAEEMKWAGELKDALSDQSINSDELLNRYEIRSGLVEITESPMLAVVDSAGHGTLLTTRVEDEMASAEYTHLKKTMVTVPDFDQLSMEDETNLMPTGGMKAEAKKYRKWKEEGHPGGTGVAAARATQILSGKPLSPSTVITMNAWFARHEVDKKGKGFSPGEEGFPSPGRVAWAAWGGDAGQSWAAEKAKVIKNKTGDATTDDSFVDAEATFLDDDEWALGHVVSELIEQGMLLTDDEVKDVPVINGEPVAYFLSFTDTKDGHAHTMYLTVDLAEKKIVGYTIDTHSMDDQTTIVPHSHTIEFSADMLNADSWDGETRDADFGINHLHKIQVVASRDSIPMPSHEECLELRSKFDQMTASDATLTTKQRSKLKSSSFCGPGRSFPVPDCAHVTAARRLIGRYKGSADTKKRIMSCVNSKAAKLGCDDKMDSSITLTNKEPAMDPKETKPSAATAPAASQTGTPVVAEDTVKVLTASLQKEQDRNKELQSQFDSATAEKNALATKLTDSEKKLHRSMCEHLALLRTLNGVKPSGYKLEDAQGLQAYVDGELVKRTSDSISDSIRDEMVVLDGKLPSLKGLGSFIQDRTQARDSGAVTAKVEDTEEVAELKIKTKKTVGKDLV